MRHILTLAGREIRDGLRNRWVLAITVLMAALALTLSFLGSAPTGNVGVGPVEVTIVSLSSLTIFLLPLIALLLSFDALVGEFERGTMMLLLTYPVSRLQIIIGKFLGHVSILAFATVLGYGAAGIALAAGNGNGFAVWRPFVATIGSSVLLGAAFVALGYLISAAVGNRGTAAGLAVGVWLAFVLLYDMALLGALVADQGRTLTPEVVNLLLLLNPADAYRLFNLTGFANVSVFAGMAGLAETLRLPPALLLTALAAWIAVPLTLAAMIFQRRQV
jgi:Cu-processing system permease protein